jgi:hypothetical protein
MIQAKQKRGFIRRATITLAAIAAGSLPMVMPQWMTSLSAQTYNYGVFDLSTETLSFSEIVIPLLDAITGEQIGDKSNVFKADLNRQPGSGWLFELDPWSFEWVQENASASNPVVYDNQTGTIDIPCVQVTFILPSPQPPMVTWYKGGLLERVDRDDPLFELVYLDVNDGTCPPTP